MNRVPLAALLIVTIGTWSAGPTEAHPHSWIDLKSKVLFDDDALIVGLEIDWLFDEYYSAFIVEEYLEDQRAPEEYLKEIAQTNIVNLRSYDYFTVVRADDQTVELEDVSDYQMGFRGDRLWLRFTVPLAEKLDPTESSVIFQNYDPTYYIEVLHVADDPVMLGDGAPENCDYVIIPPTPTTETVNLAFSLDFTQRETDGLGAHFAETIAIDCD